MIVYFGIVEAMITDTVYVCYIMRWFSFIAANTVVGIVEAMASVFSKVIYYGEVSFNVVNVLVNLSY